MQRRIPLAFFCLFFVGATLSAETFFVSNAGSDAADGLTRETAWATLQFAADQVFAGDTVIVLSGSYRGFNLFTSGTPSAPIVFRADGVGSEPDPNVVIDEPNPFTGQDGINLEGASWIEIEGFTILGSGISRAGIRCVGTASDHASNNVFRLNRVDEPGRWGIFTGFADDLLIEGNETSRAGDEHGIYVSNSGDRPVIRGNVVWGNRSNGIHMNGDASLGGDGIIDGAIVERNTIFGNGLGGGSGINCDGVQNSLIRNNLIYDTHASGISLFRIDGGAPSTGNQVINNTVIVADDGRWAMNIQDGSSNNELKNNVFLSDHPSRGSIDLCGACLPGFISDHNVVEDRLSLDDVWIDLDTWRTQTAQDGDSFLATASELFLDPAAGDYRPQVDSPALDQGEAAGAPAEDLRRVPRPQGPAWDIGAHEVAIEPILVGPEFVRAGSTNRFDLVGAPFGATSTLLGSMVSGQTNVPDCPGVSIDLGAPRVLASIAADAGGDALFELFVPSGISGRTAQFQAASRSACQVTAPVAVIFP